MGLVKDGSSARMFSDYANKDGPPEAFIDLNMRKMCGVFPKNACDKRVLHSTTTMHYAVISSMKCLRDNKDNITDENGNILEWPQLRDAKIEPDLDTPSLAQSMGVVSRITSNGETENRRRYVIFLYKCYLK